MDGDKTKPVNMGSVAVKLIAAVLLFAALGRHEYDYYALLRWICCGVAAYTGYQAAKAKSHGWLVVFVIVAVVLNPIAPVHLRRDTWVLVDVAAAVLFLVSIAALDVRRPRP